MAKSKELILSQLGVTFDSDLLTLIDTLKKYSVISDAEKNLVKLSSVHSLPTVVKNSEQDVKQRMYGIVTDEDRGAIALMNKRNVLIEQIVKRFNDKLESQENHIYIGEETPDGNYQIWLDTSNITIPLSNTFSLRNREFVDEEAFNGILDDYENEELIFNYEDEDLIFNIDDETELTFNIEQ